MNFLSLFSGIGGFDLGAYRARLSFENHFFSEVNQYAIDIFSKRFPGAIPLGDVREIKGAALPSGQWIITGGFPCQDISCAGKKKGIAQGTRSGLFFQFARLIEELRPRFAIIENVGALAVRGLDTTLYTLYQTGYDAEWYDFRAADVGAPHRRERLYIMAYPKGERRTAAPLFNFSGTQTFCKEFEGETRAGFDGCLYRCNRKYPVAFNSRMDDGVSYRVERLECIGNAIVPQIAEIIFRDPVFDQWRN
jgi:DNA (cytosine-5)-methyltransferase 1